MPDAHHLLLFIAAGCLLNLTPGPDVLYIVSNSLRSGARPASSRRWASRPAASSTSSRRRWA